MPPAEQLVILTDFVRFLGERHPHLREKPVYRDLLERVVDAHTTQLLGELTQEQVTGLYEATKQLITSD